MPYRLSNGVGEYAEAKSHKLKRSANSMASRLSSRSRGAVSTPVSENVTPHFLSDSRLLNRLLVSLSDLGDRPVHGPLLLFGAVCATSFAPVGELPRPTDEPGAIAPDSAEISTTAQLLASNYGQLAVESLKVFAFLSKQLTGADNDNFCVS